MSDTVQISTAVTEFEVAVGSVVLCVRKHGDGWDVVPRKPVLAGPNTLDLHDLKSEAEATDLAVRYGRALHLYAMASEAAERDLRVAVDSIDALRRLASKESADVV